MPDNIKILAVDDRPQNLLVLERYLEEPGIDIVRANSGNDALGQILEHKFALILMDVQMPDMDGFETAELIRQNTDSSEIPIIFITAISKEEQHVFKGYRSGAVDYLFKPFDPVVLKSKVDVFVRLYRQKTELENLNAMLETRVEQRTRELLQAKAKAEQANIAKSRFLTNMTHELMTPLHHIISYASFGFNSTQERNQEKLNQHFANILDSSSRLQYLSQNILDLSMLQSESVKLYMTKTDLENLIPVVLVGLQSAIEEKSIIMDVSKPGFSAVISCDSGKLSTMLSHVIRNAIQYSESGGKVQIEFRDERIELEGTSTDAVRVSVIDQGVGIPPEELGTIFEKFVESSSTECNSGGKGLGLAICSEIAKAHRGRIWAENTNGGTAFHILLPKQIPDST